MLWRYRYALRATSKSSRCRIADESDGNLTLTKSRITHGITSYWKVWYNNINTLKVSICVSIYLFVFVLLLDQWTESLQICTDDQGCIRECIEKFWWPYVQYQGLQRSKGQQTLYSQYRRNRVRPYQRCAVIYFHGLFKLLFFDVFSHKVTNIRRTESYNLSLER